MGAEAAGPELETEIELVEELGRGGTSAVWKGWRRADRVPVAVKLPVAPQGAEDRDRIQREARLVEGLEHPGLPRLHGCFRTSRGDLALVYDLIPGITLRERLSQGTPGHEELVRWFEDLAGALGALHARGLVHRDVKPENVILGPGSRAVLCDLGLARPWRAGQTLTATGEVHGTPGYLAPESILGARPGPAADFYALGCLLYEALAGTPPFGSGDDQTISGHLNDPIRPLSRFGAPLDRRLDEVLERLLAKRPSERITSATEASAALRRALGESSTSAPAPQGAGPLGPTPVAILVPSTPRTFQRTGAAAIASTLLVLALLLGRPTGPRVEVVPAAAHEGPAGAAPAASDEVLTRILVSRGLPGKAAPWLVALAAAEREPAMAPRLLEVPGAEAAGLGFLRLGALEAAGDYGSELAELAERLLRRETIATWQQGLQQIAALSASLLVAPAAPGRRELLVRVRQEIGSADPPWRLALRVVFWEMLARRTVPRPDLNVRALEEARHGFDELVPRLESLPVDLRVITAVAAIRAVHVLDGAPRAARIRAAVAPALDAALEGHPVSSRHWRWRLHEEEEKEGRLLGLGAAVVGLQDDPAELPLRPDEHGSGATRERVVDGPPPRAPGALALVDGIPPARGMASAADEALLEGRDLLPSEAWCSAFAASWASTEVREALPTLAQFPSSVIALERHLDARGLGAEYDRLLVQALRARSPPTASAAPTRPWLRGPRARLLLLRLRRSARDAAQLPAVRRELVREIGYLRALAPPLALEEVVTLAELWGLVRELGLPDEAPGLEALGEEVEGLLAP